MSPLYVPDPNISAEDLIDDLGRTLAERYQTAEDVLIREVALRAYRDVELNAKLALAEEGIAKARREGIDAATAEDFRAQARARADGLRYAINRNRELAVLDGHRAQALRELQVLALQTADQLRAENLAESVIEAATTQGEAEAAARLSMARRLPARTTLNGSATQATAATQFSLQSSLEILNQRITRLPVDAFQRVVAMNSSNVLLGTQTKLQAQYANVQQFLSEGITGFTDRGGRNWRIGTYAEMAGRTTVARAFNDAGVWRMQQSGINLVTIVGSDAACSRCGPWIGRTLSTDGTTGAVLMAHATQDTEVTVVIDGTLDGARNAGWGHPNCACKAVAALPGLPNPQQGFEYSPEAEKARTRQREIEVQIRAAKRRQAVAGDPVTAQRAKRQVKQRQETLRDHLAATGRKRNSAREALAFADGR